MKDKQLKLPVTFEILKEVRVNYRDARAVHSLYFVAGFNIVT